MNTFNSTINQPFYNYSSTLQQPFIANEQNRLNVMRKNIVFQFVKRIWPVVKCLELALINQAGGLYGRILTKVVSTDRTQ